MPDVGKDRISMGNRVVRRLTSSQGDRSRGNCLPTYDRFFVPRDHHANCELGVWGGRPSFDPLCLSIAHYSSPMPVSGRWNVNLNEVSSQTGKTDAKESSRQTIGRDTE